MPEIPSARDLVRDNAAMSVAALSSERRDSDENIWTRRLVLFLRVMAMLSIAKGLYHWAQVTGFIGGEDDAFENQAMAWQAATVYFAVIELVAAVGLWAPWAVALYDARLAPGTELSLPSLPCALAIRTLRRAAHRSASSSSCAC